MTRMTRSSTAAYRIRIPKEWLTVSEYAIHERSAAVVKAKAESGQVNVAE